MAFLSWLFNICSNRSGTKIQKSYLNSLMRKLRFSANRAGLQNDRKDLVLRNGEKKDIVLRNPTKFSD